MRKESCQQKTGTYELVKDQDDVAFFYWKGIVHYEFVSHGKQRVVEGSI